VKTLLEYVVIELLWIFLLVAYIAWKVRRVDR